MWSYTSAYQARISLSHRGRERTATDQVDLALMAHETSHFLRLQLLRIYNCQAPIQVVPPQPIDDRLYRLQRPLVQDEVALQDVH